MYNVVCVKWGHKYSADYVNKLFSMVKRNLTLPHRFVCFTENREGIDKEIETLSLPDVPIEGWWFKLSLFQETLYDLSGRTLFLDLDVVIVDNINCFFDKPYRNNLCIIKDWNAKQPNRIWYNSSVFTFDVGSHRQIWNKFMMNPEVNSKTPGGDQMWITKHYPDAILWPEEWCKSFKYHCQDGIPDKSKIIVFHGKPNPNEAKGWTFRNRKFVSNWVDDYWK